MCVCARARVRARAFVRAFVRAWRERLRLPEALENIGASHRTDARKPASPRAPLGIENEAPLLSTPRGPQTEAGLRSAGRGPVCLCVCVCLRAIARPRPTKNIGPDGARARVLARKPISAGGRTRHQAGARLTDGPTEPGHR